MIDRTVPNCPGKPVLVRGSPILTKPHPDIAKNSINFNVYFSPKAGQFVENWEENLDKVFILVDQLVFCKYLKTWLYEHIHCTFCYLINFYCYSWILFIYLCLLLFTRCVRNNSDMWSSSDIFSTIGCNFNQHSQSWHSSTVCCELNTRPARLVRLAFKGWALFLNTSNIFKYTKSFTKASQKFLKNSQEVWKTSKTLAHESKNFKHSFYHLDNSLSLALTKNHFKYCQGFRWTIWYN